MVLEVDLIFPENGEISLEILKGIRVLDTRY